MTAEERLRQYRTDKNTVAVVPHIEAMLRRSHNNDANIQQQLRLIDTVRQKEKEKRAEWDRGR